MDQHFHHTTPRGGYRGRGDFQRGGFRGRGRGFVDMNKPWISPAIKNELWAQINLGKAAKRSKKSEDVIAFSKHKSKVSLQLEDAKLTWLAQNPDQEPHWLNVLANEEREKSYWCDVCEKGFLDQSELEEHEQAHQTCGIDGCTYFAHAEVLDKHIMHQHLTGLYNKIAQGTSPEEIDKWRAERRKNFPTKSKVAEKIAKEKEMRERGEVMGLERKKRKREEMATKENDETGTREESQCNCKARQMMGQFRGRGRGRGRGGQLHRNVRHQGHCQELLNIRERARETRERKQKNYEDRMAKRKERGEPERKEEVEEESSEEEEPGWNGGLWKFKGTSQGFEDKVNSDESEKMEESTNISDDEFEKGSKKFKPTDDTVCTSSDSERGELIETMEQVVEMANSGAPTGKWQITSELSNSDDFKEFFEEHNAKNDAKQNVSIETNDDKPPHDMSNTECALKVESDDEPPEEISTVKGNEMNIDSDDEPPEEMAITKAPLNGYGDNSETKQFSNADIDDKNRKPDALKKTKRAKETTGVSNEQLIESTTIGQQTSIESNVNFDKNVNPSKIEGKFIADRKTNKTTGRSSVSQKSTLDRRMRPQTLLERLLRDEIVSERNKILQCVRFVCKNKFFGVDQTLPVQGPSFRETLPVDGTGSTASKDPFEGLALKDEEDELLNTTLPHEGLELPNKFPTQDPSF